MPRAVRFIDTGSRMEVARAWGRGTGWLNGHGVSSLGVRKMTWRWMVVKVAQPYECSTARGLCI